MRLEVTGDRIEECDRSNIMDKCSALQPSKMATLLWNLAVMFGIGGSSAPPSPFWIDTSGAHQTRQNPWTTFTQPDLSLDTKGGSVMPRRR